MYEDSEAVSAGPAPCYRPVRPPRKVWIKATKLWAKDHGELYRNKPDGVVLDREVLGGLTGQVLRADGGWLAEVTFQLHSANGRWHSPLYTQLVPSHLIRWDRTGRPLDEDTGLPH
jgi:hypothetical protein